MDIRDSIMLSNIQNEEERRLYTLAIALRDRLRGASIPHKPPTKEAEFEVIEPKQLIDGKVK